MEDCSIFTHLVVVGWHHHLFSFSNFACSFFLSSYSPPKKNKFSLAKYILPFFFPSTDQIFSFSKNFPTSFASDCFIAGTSTTKMKPSNKYLHCSFTWSSLQLQKLWISSQEHFVTNEWLTNDCWLIVILSFRQHMAMYNSLPNAFCQLGTFSWKNTAVLLDFVQIRGGGPAQMFCHIFKRCIFGQ